MSYRTACQLLALVCLVGCGDSGSPGGAGDSGAGDAGRTTGSGDASVPPHTQDASSQGPSDAAVDGETGRDAGADAGPGELVAPTLEAEGQDVRVRLTWEPVDGATRYTVLRGTSAGTLKKLASVKSVTYADDSVTAETKYFYRVVAAHSATESDGSNVVSATPFSFDLWHRRAGSEVLRGVAISGDTIVAVGDDMRMLTSKDGGATWSEPTLRRYGGLFDIAYGGGLFVAVGFPGLVFTSPDGLSWTQRDSGVTATLWGVAYGGKTTKKFVAVGNDATIVTSADGITWSAVANNLHHTTGGTFDYSLKDVAYGDADTFNYFVLVATNSSDSLGYAFYMSGDQDGSSWLPSPADDSGYLNAERFNAVEFGSYQATVTAVSSMHLVGESGLWAHVEEQMPGTLAFSVVSAGANTDHWRAVAFDGVDTLTLFGARIMTCSVSTSCKAGANGWTEAARDSTVAAWAGTFAEGSFVAVGANETIELLASGESTFVEKHSAAPTPKYLYSAAQIGDRVVIPTGDNDYLFSDDGGSSFTTATLPMGKEAWEFRLLGDLVYGVGALSTIARSATGAQGSWTAATTTPGNLTLYSVAKGDGLYLASGIDGETFTSTDGLAWTHAAATAGHSINELAYDGTQFVAVTEDGHILTTEDGESWDDVHMDTVALRAATANGDRIVAAGLDGHIWVSADHGKNWSPSHLTPGLFINSVARFRGSYLVTAVGAGFLSSEIWTSRDVNTWTRRREPGGAVAAAGAGTERLFLSCFGGSVFSTR